jgi:hypothetical protein
MEESLGTVFSTGSVPKLYKREPAGQRQLVLSDSLRLAIRESSLTAARKRGPEPWNPEAEDIVGIRFQAMPSEDIEDLVCAMVRNNVRESVIAL